MVVFYRKLVFVNSIDKIRYHETHCTILRTACVVCPYRHNNTSTNRALNQRFYQFSR